MRFAPSTPSAALLITLLLAAVPARADKPVVLFDEGHGQPFTAGQKGDLQLSGLGGLVREQGAEVRPVRAPLTAAVLARADALVVSGPFAPFTTAERAAVRDFVAAGGRIAVMAHINEPLQGLLEDMGVRISRGPIHERERLLDGSDMNFTVTRFAPHALTDGLKSLSVFGCWALETANQLGSVVAQTGPGAWLDSNRDRALTPGEPVGNHAVLVAGTFARGGFAVFGDDAIFQNRFLASHNMEIGRRLARWLAGGRAAAPRPRTTDL